MMWRLFLEQVQRFSTCSHAEMTVTSARCASAANQRTREVFERIVADVPLPTSKAVTPSRSDADRQVGDEAWSRSTASRWYVVERGSANARATPAAGTGPACIARWRRTRST